MMSDETMPFAVTMTRCSLVAIALTFCLTTVATAQTPPKRATPAKLDRNTAIKTDPRLSQVGKALRLGDYDRAIQQFQQAKAKTKDKCANRGYALSIAAAQATKKKFPQRKTPKQQEQAFKFYTQEFERLTIQDRNCGIPSLQEADNSRRTAASQFSSTTHPIFQNLLSTLYQRTKIPVRLPTYIPGLTAEKSLSGEEAMTQSSTNGAYSPMPNLKAAKPLLATLTSATANEYTIVLGNRPNCQGQYSCKRGSLSATKLTPKALSLQKTFQEAANFVKNPLFNEGERRSTDEMGPVTLSRNLKGYFVPWVLTDRYTEAKIIWEQDGVRYSVGMQQGDKDSLIKMANSAIKPPLAPWLNEDL